MFLIIKNIESASFRFIRKFSLLTVITISKFHAIEVLTSQSFLLIQTEINFALQMSFIVRHERDVSAQRSINNVINNNEEDN